MLVSIQNSPEVGIVDKRKDQKVRPFCVYSEFEKVDVFCSTIIC